MSRTVEPKSRTEADDLKNVGRGALFLTFTKMWFMVSGYLLVFGLNWIFGKDEEGVRRFGDYRTVTTLAAIVNAFVVFGTQQAVSRFVGRDPAAADGVRRAAYRLQALLGGGIFAVMFLGAPVIARHLWQDETLATPLRVASFITLFYAFYAVFMGYLNGSRRFGRQAFVDFSFSTAKVALILAGAALLGGAFGPIEAAIGGFAAAALVALVLGRVLSGPARGQGGLDVGTLFRFQIFTMVFSGLTTFALNGDLQVLKLLGTSGEDGKLMQGYYSAAQQFAQIPYQAVFAITFVLFPLVSGAAGRDAERMREYIRQTTRWAIIIATGIVALFFACPERAITILFRDSYVDAAAPLRILAIGYLFFSPFYIMCAVINAGGHPWTSVKLIAVTIASQVGLAALLVWRLDLGMIGAACGTMIGMTLAFVFAHAYLKRTYGQGIQVGRWFTTLACGAVVGAVAHATLARETFWGGSGLLADLGGGGGLTARLVTVVGFGALFLLYFALVFATGVLGADDRQRIARVLRRAPKKAESPS